MSPDCRRLTGEGPAVVGMLTSSLESGGSVDSAIREVASEGPRISRKLFSDAVNSVDTKCSPGLKEALMHVLDDLPEEAIGYRRAVGMCLAASESSDPTESSRILRDAADSALESVRLMGESYSSSLSFPCMAVFAIGIMVPMILMSLLPMLSIGGMFGADMVSGEMVMAVTLVLIPGGILAMCLWIRSRNPFREENPSFEGWKVSLPLLITIPLMVIHRMMGFDPEGMLLFSLAPAAVVTLAYAWGERRMSMEKNRCIDSLMDSIMDMGNRMLSGENFETAAVGSMESKVHCANVGSRLGHELEMCRGDAGLAVMNAISPVSREMASSIEDIRSCSVRDVEDAGRLAVTMGRQYQNRGVTMRVLETRLKSLTDMMFATAAVFAPMVLGLSVSMLEPLSSLAGYTGMEDTSSVLAVYLVELCVLISLLTSSLGRGGRFVDTLWRFCVMCPVSLLIFAVCGQVSL
ncbi:MAG: hypothetical protein ACI38Y_00535 [Candidatus Methanomethylophilaceae archaeon]